MNVRPWNVDDNDELIGWLNDEPGMLQMLGKTDATVADVQLQLLQDSMNPHVVTLAVESGDEVAAMVTLRQLTAMGAPVAHIITSPRKRGKAVWYARAAKRYLEDNGVKQAVALVPSGRADVKAFAERLGFHAPDVDVLVCDNGGG